MKLTIRGSGEDSPDWPGVEYALVAETTDHKTTIQYWGAAGAFKDFARDLLKFPFESKADVVYRSGNWSNSGYSLTLTVRLVDAAGRTELHIEAGRPGEFQASFASEVEAAELDELARMLEGADFTVPNKIIWGAK